VALVAGNHALYRTLLRDVAREHRHDAETIREALEGNDHARGQRMVHTLKGVLGAIGATEAHRAAAALDEALRQLADPAALAPLVDGLRQTMDPLLADLEAAFAEATPSRG
jgi:HPt (histidine-containing phosphotransfer) domain-containing protein